MTTEQKNESIALFLGFELDCRKYDWSDNQFYNPPKWFEEENCCDWNIESIELGFDYDYHKQLTAIDWIEENYKDWRFDIFGKITVLQFGLRQILFEKHTRKEAIFESLYWLSQNYKNYL